MTLPNRFWSKVDVHVDGCWLWTGALNWGGYGVYRTHPTGTQLAHRIAYTALVAAIPADRPHLDHLCRVNHCVFPEHLEPVTNKENLHRGISRFISHALRTHCPRGHLLDEANTYQAPSGPRHCRTCIAEGRIGASRMTKRSALASTSPAQRGPLPPHGSVTGGVLGGAGPAGTCPRSPVFPALPTS